jgi:predicted Zn-dependent peptidase
MFGQTFPYTTVRLADLESRVYTLPNGLTAIITPTDHQPRVSVNIVVKTGSKNDPSDATGLAHYLEHMLFKGSTRMGTLNYAAEKPLLDQITALYEQYRATTDAPNRARIYASIDSLSSRAATFAIGNEFDKAMQAIGAQGINAFTSTDITDYVGSAPSTHFQAYMALERERFRSPVFRIFHTELEAVYEEKNISLGSDGDLVSDTLQKYIFAGHTYGTQSTLGSIEHLKNPSLVRIKEYYDTYYVPNNMVVVIAGDVQFDDAIRAVNDAFGYKQARALPPYSKVALEPLPVKNMLKLTGNEASNVTFAWRWPGANHPDIPALRVLDLLLSNGVAGLIDTRVSQAQRAIDAYSYQDVRADYSMHRFGGMPVAGESLDNVVQLLLQQVRAVQQGEFSDSLLASVVRSAKRERAEALESNDGIINLAVDAIQLDIPYDRYLKGIDAMAAVTRADILRVAKKYYSDAPFIIEKIQGTRTDIPVVEKPAITPVNVQRSESSPFVDSVLAIPAGTIKPQFNDFSRAFTTTPLAHGAQLYSTQFEKELYTLEYRFSVGSRHNRLLPLAARYWPLLGTATATSAQLQSLKYWFATAVSLDVNEEHTTLTIRGLDETFPEALQFVHNWINDCTVNNELFEMVTSTILQERENNISNKDFLGQQALYTYALYGNNSNYHSEPTNAELVKIQPSELVALVRSLFTTHHSVLYTGKRSNNDVALLLRGHHKNAIAAKATPLAPLQPAIPTKPIVYVMPFSMPQAEVLVLGKVLPTYDSTMSAMIAVFNEYYSGGMSGITFQTLRESKALAYSTNFTLSPPASAVAPTLAYGFIGTQADKTLDALRALRELMTTPTKEAGGLARAKNSIVQQLSTFRARGLTDVYSYLNGLRRGTTTNQRSYIYNNVPKVTLESMTEFFTQYVARCPYIICILGDPKVLPMDKLQEFGTVTIVSPEQTVSWMNN